MFVGGSGSLRVALRFQNPRPTPVRPALSPLTPPLPARRSGCSSLHTCCHVPKYRGDNGLSLRNYKQAPRKMLPFLSYDTCVGAGFRVRDTWFSSLLLRLTPSLQAPDTEPFQTPRFCRTASGLSMATVIR